MLARDRLRLINMIAIAACITFGGAVWGAAPVGYGHDDEDTHAVPSAKTAPVIAPAVVVPAVDTTATKGGHDAAPSVSAADAMKRLADGNDRFVAGVPQRPNQNISRLCETFTGGQHPYAAVLSCADSRVPPELVFDAGIGDLFVVRVAGNVADVDEVGTLEYGVEHLGINAIVVIGHTKCGAVTAVVENTHVTPNIAKLVDNIVPAVEESRKAFPQVTGARLVTRAIRTNVRYAATELTARSPLLKKYVDSGRLKIVGGVYDLHTGQVDWIDSGEGSPVKLGPVTNDPASNAHAPSHGPSKAVAVDPHDAHAAPAAVHGDPRSNAESKQGGHDEHSAATDVHGDPIAAAPTTKPAAKQENFVALGGCLGAAGVASCAIMFFMKGKPAQTEQPIAAIAHPA